MTRHKPHIVLLICLCWIIFIFGCNFGQVLTNDAPAKNNKNTLEAPDGNIIRAKDTQAIPSSIPPASPKPWPTDIPGEDMQDVPRPPDGVRIIYQQSVTCNTYQYRANIYYVPGSHTLSEIGHWYEAKMKEMGYKVDSFTESKNGEPMYKWNLPDPSRPTTVVVNIWEGPANFYTFANCRWQLPVGREDDLIVALFVKH